MWGRQGVPVRGSAFSSSLAVNISVVPTTSNEGHISVLQLNKKQISVGNIKYFWIKFYNGLRTFHVDHKEVNKEKMTVNQLTIDIHLL